MYTALMSYFDMSASRFNNELEADSYSMSSVEFDGRGRVMAIVVYVYHDIWLTMPLTSNPGRMSLIILAEQATWVVWGKATLFLLGYHFRGTLERCIVMSSWL